jgi:TetR/AcrR family transcriptional repressor of lmrAB and yxaGH operons
MTARKGERTRATILDTTSALLRRQGYAATGLNQIVDEAGAPKGSLYFHFPGGKDELVAAAMIQAADAWRAELFAAIGGETDLARTLTIVGDRLARELETSSFLHGCPIATVTLEASSTNPLLQAVISERYTVLEQVIADRVIAAGATRAHARSVALLVLSSLEGALLLARAHRDAGVVRVVAGQLAMVAGSFVTKRPRRRRKPR